MAQTMKAANIPSAAYLEQTCRNISEMNSESLSIARLPQEVQAQIKSSVAIASLNDVVVGLLENALDAGAMAAQIHLDYVKGYCSVIDDGTAIPANEFEAEGQLGTLHCTSKLDPPRPTYGKYGRFLAYLASMSILSITSKRYTAETENTITFHRGNIIARSLVEETQFGTKARSGTKVVVANLFGDVPVRFKHNAARFENTAATEIEFGILKRRIVSLLLASGLPLEVKLVELKSGRKYRNRVSSETIIDDTHPHHHETSSFDLAKISSLLQQAGYINRTASTSWRKFSARTSSLQIRAAVSLNPAPSQHMQFISLGIRPLTDSQLGSIFRDEINGMFEFSSFGAEEDDVELSEEERIRRLNDRRFKQDLHTNRQLGGQKKGVDRWPVFFVKIDLLDATSAIPLDETRVESESSGRWIEKVIDLLRSMFYEFLSSQNFRPRARRELRRLEEPGVGKFLSPNFPVNAQTIPSHFGADVPLRLVLVPMVNRRPFENWSRLKVGSSELAQQNHEDCSVKGNHSSTVDTVKRNPQNPKTKVAIAQRALGGLEFQALSSADLEALVEDFSDSRSDGDTESENDKSCQSGIIPSAATINCSIPEEDTYLWKSPTTGIEVKVSARTGLIVPPSRGDNHNKAGDLGSMTYNARPASAPTKVPQPRSKRLPTPQSTGLREEWVRSLLNNDLVKSFRLTERPIRSIAREETEDVESKTMKTGHRCQNQNKSISEYFAGATTSSEQTFSKTDLRDAGVVTQVDRKFILLRITGRSAVDDEGHLVLIDQHAADERVKVEELYSSLCNSRPISLSKHIIFEVDWSAEVTRFQAKRDYLADWGIGYDVKTTEPPAGPATRPPPSQPHAQIIVHSLPELIGERCRLDPKVLIDLLRREIWSDSTSTLLSTPSQSQPRPWISRIPHCPRGLVEMINSRACRSAIMFNDLLSREQCVVLVQRLAQCMLPFQCAHGRPSIVVLPRVEGVVGSGGVGVEGGERPFGFGKAFKKWQEGKA